MLRRSSSWRWTLGSSSRVHAAALFELNLQGPYHGVFKLRRISMDPWLTFQGLIQTVELLRMMMDLPACLLSSVQTILWTDVPSSARLILSESTVQGLYGSVLKLRRTMMGPHRTLGSPCGGVLKKDSARFQRSVPQLPQDPSVGFPR